ncbi:hypothetical protein MNAN1_002935 [Malassezia nana]|uniref:Uncharacterized protein n=1 Tax=Malassezia nana TaxID=180528 RepID=A0AAF0EKA2_9BASI|nr:hypothetical protein MNAN1_002935 [Malassezia nana]
MPQATLDVPAVYPVVGIYRLVHDEKLWRPMWESCYRTVGRASLVTIGWTCVSLPVQRLVSRLFLGRVGRVVGAKATYTYLQHFLSSVGLPSPSFELLTTVLLVLNQVNVVLNMFLGKELRRFRATAYDATVASRGKPAEFWSPFTEEFAHPDSTDAAPVERGVRARLRNRLVHALVRKVVSVLFGSVPVFGLLVGSALHALQYGAGMHKPYFAAKHMNAQQQSIWVEERRTAYFVFGFVVTVLEHIPVLGLIFSISNRIGAAMWAHDLEKRQHRFHTGELVPETTPHETVPREGEPGSYGHPDRPDVVVPGGLPASITQRASRS